MNDENFSKTLLMLDRCQKCFRDSNYDRLAWTLTHRQIIAKYL